MVLMDATVASGAAAIMAMRVLVEHDVPEENIILISLIMAVQGAYSVAYAYPSVSLALLFDYPFSSACFPLWMTLNIFVIEID